MNNMTLKYNKVLILGATSGIGLAYAEKVVEDGKKVIVTGRRKERLDSFISKYGTGKADAIEFDITKLSDIPSFVEDTFARHPDLDCVILNSGIQRGFDFSKPESVDLDVISEEFTTNYLAYVYFTKSLLPHLQKQQNETALVYLSSGLALVPIPRCLNYCATKAALHQFLLSLREQVKEGPGNVKIVEILPPAVQTELHDEKHQPDLKGGSHMGMPLDEYTKESWEKLARGDEQIPVGRITGTWQQFEVARQNIFKQVLQVLKGSS